MRDVSGFLSTLINVKFSLSEEPLTRAIFALHTLLYIIGIRVSPGLMICLLVLGDIGPIISSYMRVIVTKRYGFQ